MMILTIIFRIMTKVLVVPIMTTEFLFVGRGFQIYIYIYIYIKLSKFSVRG